MKKILKRKVPIIKVKLEEYKENFVFDEDSNTISYKKIIDDELVNKDKYRIVLDTCKLKNVRFNDNNFYRSEFIDVIFDNCDLSNNTFENCIFIRCEFKSCKLLGSTFYSCAISDVLIEDSISKYVVIAENKITSFDIINSSFEESSFFDNNLKNTIFESVNFKKAIFSETKLKDIDLSTCNIDNIRIDHKSIEGAVVALNHAEIICDLLGVKIK